CPDRILSILQQTPYKSGGILPSELAAFLSLAEAREVDAIIESGRSLGYSTEVLANWSQSRQIPIHSIETHPIAIVDEELRFKYVDLSLHREDGLTAVPRLSQQYQRPAILLDGPKGEKALALWQSVSDHCVFGAVHDVSRRREGSQGLE